MTEQVDKKISKCKDYLNNTISRVDLNNMYRTLHPKTAKCTFGIYIQLKIGDRQGHNNRENAKQTEKSTTLLGAIKKGK